MSNLNPSSPIQKIQHFVRSNLVATIVSSISLNLVLIGASTWNVWDTSQGLRVTVERQTELQDLSSKVIYLDEVLTMSANMRASSGQIKWEQRYNDRVPELDKVTGELFKDIPPSVLGAYRQIDDSNKALIAMETQSFQLAKEQKLAEAAAVLQSAEYSNQKKIYSQGVQTVIASVKAEANARLQSQQLALNSSIVLALVSLGLLVITGMGIVIAVRGYIRDRQLAQANLQSSQDNLLQVNSQLENESFQRQIQSQSTSQENEQLQQDIGELLDVVCEIESGNLTITAQVNDRATGLVSDTLNRLIEELGRTLRQVSVAAYRVDANSKTQKDLAATVAQSTSKQSEEVGQMLLLTRNVRQSAQNTMQQLNVTNQSLVTLQSSVTEGQGTISSLDREIDVLQAGSDRIVQEIKTLGEFVGLADRFVQDQGEIVTQTQILALNASLVAARAAEQRDPKQFAGVAREFELIATQVSQLAQQTSEGLASLEQRSSQIHQVVSSVDVDVQKLGGLVNTFTQGVKQASDVFATVQAVTAQVVESGNLVSTASQRIVTATDSTTIAIESISTLSQEISHQSQDAQNLGDQLNILSTNLLENIQIFKLPAAPVTEHNTLELAI
ncbi:methyl-accepting chemotaxis protein [Chamaesiphon sp. GL140_3_metabinner_50]|uniref:methyl-accepting chemotaxis protein n=1 Tax=Chamaesiphon sp. GL140_3_metabinner_50 TaxID=2970812 RepID=UPI0025D0A826|nr:methyl-accepting chemotaxis protein [Chamaesiphon sp. GL140_3_metabinner_50]